MYTRCPNCTTIFRVTAEQLRTTYGDIPCMTCAQPFNALDSLSDDITALITTPVAGVTSAVSTTATRDQPPPDEGGSPADLSLAADDVVTTASADDDTTPAFAESGTAVDDADTASHVDDGVTQAPQSPDDGAITWPDAEETAPADPDPDPDPDPDTREDARFTLSLHEDKHVDDAEETALSAITARSDIDWKFSADGDDTAEDSPGKDAGNADTFNEHGDASTNEALDADIEADAPIDASERAPTVDEQSVDAMEFDAPEQTWSKFFLVNEVIASQQDDDRKPTLKTEAEAGGTPLEKKLSIDDTAIRQPWIGNDETGSFEFQTANHLEWKKFLVELNDDAATGAAENEDRRVVEEPDPVTDTEPALEPVNEPDPFEDAEPAFEQTAESDPLIDLEPAFERPAGSGPMDDVEPALEVRAESEPSGDVESAFDMPAEPDAFDYSNPALDPAAGLEPIIYAGQAPDIESEEQADTSILPLWLNSDMADDVPPTSPESRRSWAVPGACVVLALFLAGQLLHHNRDALAATTSYGAAVRQVYALFGASLYPDWPLDAFEVTGTEAISGRSSENALDILANVIVRSQEPVGLPFIRVVLRDRWSNPVAARVFTPHEYLREFDTMAPPINPGVALPVEISVADPGAEALGYVVDVCLPRRKTGLECQIDKDPFQ